MKKTLATMLGTAILSGCAGNATTNTYPVKAGREDYTFKEGRIDWINAGHDKYAPAPMEENTIVMIKGKEDHHEPSNVLEGRLIPYSNSTITRTRDGIIVRPNDNPSYLVNFFYNKDGKLAENLSEDPVASYFIVERKQFPVNIVKDDLDLVESHIMERVIKKPGKIEFNGKTLVPIYDLDIGGRLSRAFIDISTIEPRYDEIRVPGKDSVFKFGFEGVGYYITEGKEIKVPSEEDKEKNIEVIEGAPATLTEKEAKE